MSDEIVTEGGDETATVDAYLAEAGIELPPELTEGEPEPKEDAEPKEDPKPKDAKAQEEKRKEEIRAKRVADHLRREAQFRKQTEVFQKELTQKTQELDHHYGVLSQAKTQLEQVYGKIQENPMKFLQEEFGIGPEQYFEWASRGGEAPPDHMAAQLERKWQERFNQIEQKLSQTEQARQEALARIEREEQARLEAQQTKAQQQARVQAQQGFLSEIRGNTEAFPDLALYSDEHILGEATQLVDMLMARAQKAHDEDGDDTLLKRVNSLSYNDIATALQEGVAEWHAQIRGGKSSNAKPSAQQSAAPSRAKTGPQVVTRRLPAKPELEQTLSNSMSASRGSAKNIGDDVDYDALKAELIREMERNARG